MAVVVFALVAELARVSQDGLDSAISQDSGLRGSYEVVLDESYSTSSTDAFAQLRAVADRLAMSVWGFWEDSPAIRSECPPFEQLGAQQLRFLWRSPGEPFSLPFGHVGGVDTTWCIDGQAIPASALYLPASDEQAVFGTRLYARPDYEHAVLLATVGPLRRGFVLASGIDADLKEAVQQAVTDEIREEARRQDLDASVLVTVKRLDQENRHVRDASRGVAVTYGLIGWGVLALAGIALVAMQVIVTRQRAWFYGLVRAMGATRTRVATVLAVDAGVVLVCAVLLAGVILTASQATIARFAAQSFGVDAHVVSAPTALKVSIGLLLIFGVTVTISTTLAARRDPLDALEAPRD